MSKESANVQVVVRLRPMNDRENTLDTLPVVTASTSDRSITVIKGSGSRQQRSQYEFDNVFGMYSTQEEVFNSTLRPVIKDVLNGFESTVFAYGQTGTGKTHTMEGSLAEEQEQGIIPRSAASIFDALKDECYVEHEVTCQYLEIYNEELCDLFVDNTKKKEQEKLTIMDSKGGVTCAGLSKQPVGSAADVLAMMEKARTQRRIGETKMNKQSSRSHCLFTLNVKAKKQYPDGVMEVNGKLHMVDLAGSECAKTATLDKADKASATRERERMNINRSLLTLGRVISCLKEQSEKKNSNVRVPYRDSKLTRVLQESLGGRCKTVIIATLSPSVSAIEESISTLNYAQSANSIVNKPVATSYLSVGGGSAAMAGGKQGSEAGGSQSLEHWHEMECRLQYMQAQVEEAQGALARKHMQQQEIVARAEAAEKKSEELTENLKETQHQLTKSFFSLKSTQNTEEKMNEVVKSLFSTLKASVCDGNTLHSALSSNIEHEKECRAQAKTFSVSATALTNTVKEQITSLNEAVTTHLISSLETHTAAAATSTTTLNSTLKLNSSIKENVSSFTTSATSVLTDDVMAVCANIQSSTEEKVNAIVKTFEDGERLLETEIDQGVKEAETKVELLSSTHTSTFATKCEVALSKDTETLKSTAATLNTIQSNLSTALDTTKEKKAAIVSELDALLLGLSETLESQTTALTTDCDEITSIVKNAVAHYEETTPHSDMGKETAALQGSTTEFEASMATKIEQQQILLEAQKKQFLQQKEEQLAAQQQFVKNVMDSMATLMADQNKKLAETTEATFNTATDTTSSVSTSITEANTAISDFTTSTSSSLDKIQEQVNVGLEVDKFVVDTMSTIEGGVKNIAGVTATLKNGVSEVSNSVQKKVEVGGEVDSAFYESTTEAGAEVEGVSSSLTGDVTSTIAGNLEEVQTAGKEAISFGVETIQETIINMNTMKDPRENVKEEVVDGASNVMSEIKTGIGGVESVATKVVTDIEAMSVSASSGLVESEELLAAEIKEIKQNLEAVESASKEIVAKIQKTGEEEVEGVEKVKEGIVQYATELVKCDEEVKDVEGRKFYDVEEAVYVTPSVEDITAAFGDGEGEIVEKGMAPVKETVSVGIATLMSIDERVQMKQKEAAAARKLEIDQENDKKGMDGKARRRSSIKPGEVGVLADVSSEKLNSPRRKSVGGEKLTLTSANSPKRGRGGRAVSPKKGGSRKTSPRPSTAGAVGGRNSSSSGGSVGTGVAGKMGGRRTARNAGVVAGSKDC
ncbi:hypothetical protein TrLO_g8416 [Triparma laevis f. longispina]|uniref:Kinesin motor domain-containing protein n=1 Tax=Triparma laevis f. longispina TaxID=1714387 RepID=A0A9W7AHL7_9STRA|nr:hypothetical protein TrLO_g8416 [Triparma laevis f. longispina]